MNINSIEDLVGAKIASFAAKIDHSDHESALFELELPDGSFINVDVQLFGSDVDEYNKVYNPPACTCTGPNPSYTPGA